MSPIQSDKTTAREFGSSIEPASSRPRFPTAEPEQHRPPIQSAMRLRFIFRLFGSRVHSLSRNVVAWLLPTLSGRLVSW
jgi:hypothetical protein